MNTYFVKHLRTADSEKGIEKGYKIEYSWVIEYWFEIG